MHANSRQVVSSQSGTHPDLLRTLQRHRQAPFRKPVANYSQEAFALVQGRWQELGRPGLILDAACGTGQATAVLARHYPDHLVIGVDQSAHRLARSTPLPPNALLLRADMVDIWRLLYTHGLYPERQYLLYPNPWPRKQHLQRRWHGHPVFPVIAALGGRIECRSNWMTYVEECAACLAVLSGQSVVARRWTPAPEDALTAFEAKYLASGHELWQCVAQLPPNPVLSVLL